MSIYRIFMLITIPVLAIGWIAYWWWMRKIAEEERNQPREVSKRLTQTKSEVSDWAQKMAGFKPPGRKKFEDDE
ncbi:MAG: hypothetical protein ISS70_22045 [Phycisphaerae bacterium]|nr:hypothetical protein [Phycisphaerae bacterium]